jgi:tetratricopeptide (TPR) repeat protein
MSGQTGAVGNKAQARDNTFNQITNAENSRIEKQVQGETIVTLEENAGNNKIATGDKSIVAEIVNINQTAPATYTALHQLPSPPSGFVGRKKEIKELLKLLEKGGITISGLHGMGGVGKTALALKLAHHLKAQYSDAQFYLDLKGASLQPLTAAEAMSHVIRAYHPTAQLPEEESSLRAIYLSVLDNQKALLLMDNAAGHGQIEPLIPPPECVLLVTSRNRFTVNGLAAKNLDTLEASDAKQLLLKIAPRIGNCAEKIAELCGYLPLALELAASALNKMVMLTAEEYVQRLTEATRRLQLVEASLSLSYDLLTKELQKCWRMLAIFPNTFDTAAVIALWGVPVVKAQDLLAELISYSLIEWNAPTRRYRLHDLLKLLAHNRVNHKEQYSAGKLHAIYYRQVLAQAGALYTKGSDKVTQGLALFDLERENIDSGQDWAAANADGEEEILRLSMEYYYAAYLMLDIRLHPREDIRWLEISLKAAHKLGDRTYQSYSIGNLGAAYYVLGETGKAIEFYEQNLKIAHEIGDRQGEGTALGNLGLAYANLGETRKAIEFHEQALLIDREIGDRRGEAADLGNLGLAYANLGETRKAIEFYEEWLLITREIGDRRGEGQAFGNLGNAYADLGETDKAIEFHEQALLIDREIGDRRGEGQVLGNLGNAYADLGETGKAIEFYEQQLMITREIGDRRGEGNALWNSALAYDKLGDRTLAILRAEKALEIYEQIEAPGIAEKRATLEIWKTEKG